VSYQQKISSIVFIFLSIALSACGGGGDTENTAPIAIEQTVSTLAGSDLSITLSGSDADNDTLTYAIASQPTNGTLSGTAPNVTYIPETGYRGADSFTFTVNDGTLTSSAAIVDINVNNNVPTANSQSGEVHAGNEATFNLTGADLDNDRISFTIVDAPGNGEIVVSEGGELDGQNTLDVSYTPNEGYTGEDSLTFTVNDGIDTSELATVLINVNNAAPIGNAQQVTTGANKSLNITLSGSDLDGDPLNYAVVNAPTNGSLSGVAPDVTYTPNVNFIGSDSFTFTVSDGIATSAEATISIDISNIVPVANSQAVTTHLNTEIEVGLTGQDGDGDPLTYSIVTEPANGSLIGDVPNVTYIPNVNFVGNDSFTFNVSDGASTSDPATVDISVTNTAPVAVSQSISVDANTDADIVLVATDGNNDPLTYQIATIPTGGTLSGTPPNVIYTPDASFTGNDSFTFTANDGAATSLPATVDINIPDSVPEPFSFTDIPEITPSTEIISETVTITGLAVSSVVSISDGEYSIDGGAYTAVSGTITNNQTIAVRVISSATAGAVVNAVLDIGGIQDTFSVTTSSDVTAPVVNIVFPTLSTFTTGRVVRVRGTTTDDGTVNSVTVNGFAATSDDDFANWVAVVDLSAGDNTLTAQATDLGGNANVAQPLINIESITLPDSHTEIEYNNTDSSLLAFDNGMRALLNIDVVSKKMTPVSTPTFPDDINSVALSNDFKIDETTGTAFTLDVVNSRTDRVIGIDIASGSRSILTGDAKEYPTHALVIPNSVEVDAANSYAYVLDLGRRGIMRFDLSTGEGGGFSDYASFSRPDSAGLDERNNRILLTDPSGSQITAIDLTTGAQSVFSNSSVPDNVNSLVYPKAIVVDPDPENNRAFVYDVSSKQIMAVDLGTGARTIVAEGIVLPGAWQYTVIDMIYDGVGNALYLSQSDVPEIYKVDISTGSQTLFSSNTVPDDVNPLIRPGGLTLDSAGGRILVSDWENMSIIAVKLTDGTRQVVSSSTIPDDSNPLNSLRALAFNSGTGIIYVVNDTQLLAVNSTSGLRTVVSDNTTPDTDNTFFTLNAIVNDVAGNRVLVADSPRKSIIGIDKDSGIRTVISDQNTPSDTNPLNSMMSMVMEGGRALVLDNLSKSIFSVNLTDGTRTVLSGPGVPDMVSQLSRPLAMALDAANSRILVVDENGVIAVSLTDGSRSAFSTSTIPSGEHPFGELIDITIDSNNGQALIFDTENKVVLAVDLNTGARSPYYGTFPAEQITLIYDISALTSHIGFDMTNNKALVSASNISGSRSLVNIDLNNGMRSLIADDHTPVMGDTFPFVYDIEFDSGNRAIMLGLNELYEIDTSTGVRNILSNNTIPNVDNPFSNQANIAIDRTAQVAYAANGSSILSVDLTSGQRALLSDNTIPDATNPFSSIRDIAFDAETGANRLWVLDAHGQNIIIQVDVDTGIRTPLVLSGVNVNFPSGILMDESNDRLLLADSGAILGVDLSTGIVTRLTRFAFAPSTGFASAGKMAFTSQENVILLKDRDSGVMMVDLISGEQVIISK